MLHGDKRGFGVVTPGTVQEKTEDEFHAKSCQGEVERQAEVADKIKVKMRVVAEAHAPNVLA